MQLYSRILIMFTTGMLVLYLLLFLLGEPAGQVSAPRTDVVPAGVYLLDSHAIDVGVPCRQASDTGATGAAYYPG